MRYVFDVTCPRCGGNPKHVTETRPDPTLTVTSRAICQCAECHAEWLLTLNVTAVTAAVSPNKNRPPCGTEGGYKAHTRRGEPSCRACRDAHRIYQCGTPSGMLTHRKRKVDA